jgi:rhodanese-related sulfurtransferase
MKIQAGIALSFALGLAACHSASTESNRPAAAEQDVALKEVTVDQVAGFVQSKSATILDANGPETRSEQGVVPGAVLLSSSSSYALSELPAAKDKKLVFYCGGTMCRASDSAAKRAIGAGYADVSVMRAGIKGWKDAGKDTESPRS